MPFTTEAEVRLKFRAGDTDQIPAGLVNQSIEDAHTELLAELDPAHNTEPPADALALGETLLAGAHLLRALAAQEAIEQKQLAIGGHRIDAGKRFPALIALAEKAEQQAWIVLAPFLRPRAPVCPAAPTPATPLGA